MLLYITIIVASLFASGLTLFSGFGLGTLLMPVFAVFFPLELAIGLTAVVHLLNNLFKFFLLGKFADREIVFKFGLPAIIASFFGAFCLILFAREESLLSYSFFGKSAEVTVLKLVIAGLMIFFAVFEILPKFKDLAFDRKYLPLGGMISGFLGGISGHQGALRSAFLIRAGLTREGYIGTGIVIACLVDLARLAVYNSRFADVFKGEFFAIGLCAGLSAFLGAWLGNRFLHKVTLHKIQLLVSFFLVLIALALATGLI